MPSPGRSTLQSAVTTALVNADSWAYFCGDVLGAVPKAAVKKALS